MGFIVPIFSRSMSVNIMIYTSSSWNGHPFIATNKQIRLQIVASYYISIQNYYMRQEINNYNS